MLLVRVLVAFLLALGADLLAAKEVLYWARTDLPPFDIIDPRFANKGILSNVRRLVQVKLPEYEHIESDPMNAERLVALLDSQNLCYSAAMRIPEREPVLYLSIGIGIMPAQNIVTTQAIYDAYFARLNKVSLAQVIQDKQLTLGLPTRLLGPLLDPIIQKHEPQANILRRKASNTEGLYQMLNSGRIDYTLDYPANAAYWQLAQPHFKLVNVPISETSGHYNVGRIGCSKNEWGRKMIVRINAILRQIRLTDDYIKATHLLWIDASQQSRYLADYQRLLSHENWSNAE